MEALADFGTVNLLNYRALTDTIYRVWYGAFDRRAALQLGAVLLGLVLLMLAAGAAARGAGARRSSRRGDPGVRQRLRGARALVGGRRPRRCS